MEELQLDHEPSMDHWAKVIAKEDIASGEETNWDYAYEQAWNYVLYSYEYREGW
jgi:hypothetical protein|tara:strand:- start:78 stop:239 length:162 start_codon:yes stop_codon:yes gene_type:complete